MNWSGWIRSSSKSKSMSDTKYAHWSRSGAEYSKAEVATAELAVSEYEQGRYIAELMALEKDIGGCRVQLW